MRGDLPKREPQWIKQWQDNEDLRKSAASAPASKKFHAARRPAVCQRR
jgi:isoleucyl-tRNA synthetase